MGEICYISVGSNLGKRDLFLKRAHGHLRTLPKTVLTGVSSIYETQPEGPVPQPWFLNEVVALRTLLEPEELLFHCLRIENQEGRVRNQTWGPRTLDLDILLFGNRIVQQEQLQIPHPRLAERRFVLTPLAEIAPSTVHPIIKKSVKTLLNELKGNPHVFPYSTPPVVSNPRVLGEVQ